MEVNESYQVKLTPLSDGANYDSTNNNNPIRNANRIEIIKRRKKRHSRHAKEENRLKEGCTNLMYACQQGLTDKIIGELRSEVIFPFQMIFSHNFVLLFLFILFSFRCWKIFISLIHLENCYLAFPIP